MNRRDHKLCRPFPHRVWHSGRGTDACGTDACGTGFQPVTVPPVSNRWNVAAVSTGSVPPASSRWVCRRSPTGGTTLLIALILSIVPTGCATHRITADISYFPQPPAAAHAIHLKSFNSLHDLVPRTLSFIEILKGAPPSPFVQTPTGIEYHDGHLYICDTGMGVVHVWNLADGSTTRIGTDQQGHLGKPVDVAVDSSARVFVADTVRGEVVCFDQAGRFSRTIRPPADNPYRPVALAIQSGDLLVADLAGHRIDRFEIESGAQGEARITETLDYPTGVATDAAGQVVVTEMLAARVRLFDSTGQQTAAFGRPGDRYGDLGKPKHVAIGPDGSIFIADPEFAHVHIFDPAGKLLMLLGGPDQTIGATPMPFGLAIAREVPDPIARLVPDDFRADYFLFVTNTLGANRINLFAIGGPR